MGLLSFLIRLNDLGFMKFILYSFFRYFISTVLTVGILTPTASAICFCVFKGFTSTLRLRQP
jgi:hypothetical protein